MLFISHRTSDKAAAEDLKSRALARGYSAEQLFLDSDPDAGIGAGENWRHVIYNRLKQCQALIVVYSPRWRESVWCPAELGAAETLGKHIFPVVIEECPIDAILSERQAICVFKEGEAAYERLWQALESHGLGPHDYRPWPPLDEHGRPTDPCPFPGLLAFSERFAPVYFGREPETTAVLETLNTMRDRGEPRLLLIHGGSGSGKSSLLRAGVLPRLAHQHDAWLVLPTLRYGESNDDPLGKLAANLVSPSPMDWKELRTELEADDSEQATRAFHDATQDLRLDRGCPDATILLPIDQFEEFLTSAARQSADRFLRFLHALLSQNNGRLLAIATLRSDHLDVYERHHHVLQSPYLRTDRLPPFPWERVTDVIVQPAARVGVSFEPALVERLKHDAPDSDALPLLAFTLEKLFRQCAGDKLIELTEYKSLGGMTGAISQAVKNILPAKLSPETEQALRLSFVRHLVQVNENDEFVRRPARKADLPAAARPLLEKFVDERLLHISGIGEATAIEVSHEALFRCWGQLKSWLDAELTNLRLRRKLELTAREWNESIKPDRPTGDEDLFFTMGQLEAVGTWRQEVTLLSSEEAFLTLSRQKALRKIKRLKWAVIGTTAVAVVAIVLGIAAWKQRSIAILSERSAKELLVGNHIDRGMTDIQAGNRAQGLTRLAAAYEFAPPGLLRDSARSLIGGWSWHLGIPLLHDGSVIAMAFSPDGETVLTGSEDSTARLWNARTGAPRGDPLKHDGPVGAMAFSPDGETVLTGSDNNTTRLWNARTGAPRGEPLKHAISVGAVAFSPDGEIVLAGRENDTARVWNARTGVPRGEPLKHEGQIVAMAFSPDGETVLTGSEDMTARLWNARTGAPRGEPLKHEWTVDAVAFSPDGEKALTGSWDTTARLWDAQTGAPRGDPLKHAGMVFAVAFSPDGETVLTGSRDQTARLWNARTGAPRGDPLNHEGWVRAVAFSPDGETVLTGSADNTARLWNARTGAPRGEPLKHGGSVWAVAFGPNSETVHTGSADKTARLWNARTGAPRGEPLKHAGPVVAVALSPDGETVLTGSAEKTARLWNARTGAPRGEPLKHAGTVFAVAFSPDSETVLTGSEDKTARLWNAQTGAPRGEPLKHAGTVFAVAFSPDSETVLTGSEDKTARLWNARTGAPRGEPLKHELMVLAVAFSPDGETVLTGSEDKTARLWNARTGAPRGEPLKHEDWVRAVAFSPDGETVLTGSFDMTARLWNARTGAPRGEPLKHAGTVWAVAFSPDGETVLTGNDDGTAWLWSVPPPALDEPERLRLSVEVRTTWTFDEQGLLRRLKQAEWLQRRQRLEELGGPCDVMTWEQFRAASGRRGPRRAAP